MNIHELFMNIHQVMNFISPGLREGLHVLPKAGRFECLGVHYQYSELWWQIVVTVGSGAPPTIVIQGYRLHMFCLLE